MHYMCEVRTTGELLKVLATQPLNDVWIEGRAGEIYKPKEILNLLNPNSVSAPLLKWGTGNPGELTIDVNGRSREFKLRWSNSRRGFISYNTRVHYFIPAESGLLVSLCKLNRITNDLPICYPNLNDANICKKCLTRFRETADPSTPEDDSPVFRLDYMRTSTRRNRAG
jgi:hypothetical protein